MFEAVHEVALAPRLSLPAATRVFQPHGFVDGESPAELPGRSSSRPELGAGRLAGHRDNPTGAPDRSGAERRHASDVYGRKVLLYGRDVFPRGRPGRPQSTARLRTTRRAAWARPRTSRASSPRELTPARDFVSVEASRARAQPRCPARRPVRRSALFVLSAPCLPPPSSGSYVHGDADRSGMRRDSSLRPAP